MSNILRQFDDISTSVKIRSRINELIHKEPMRIWTNKTNYTFNHVILLAHHIVRVGIERITNGIFCGTLVSYVAIPFAHKPVPKLKRLFDLPWLCRYLYRFHMLSLTSPAALLTFAPTANQFIKNAKKFVGWPAVPCRISSTSIAGVWYHLTAGLE
ncbi:hypothetical protein D9M69_549950 [compost metagenome]